MKESLKSLAKNRNYIIATVATGQLILFTYLVSTLIGQFIEPFGFDDQAFSELLGLCFNLCGIAGSIVFVIIMNRASVGVHR